MSKSNEASLIFLIVGAVVGLMTGAIFFAVKNEWVQAIFGSGYTSFLISFAVCLFGFSIAGLGVGLLLSKLRS